MSSTNMQEQIFNKHFLSGLFSQLIFINRKSEKIFKICIFLIYVFTFAHLRCISKTGPGLDEYFCSFVDLSFFYSECDVFICNLIQPSLLPELLCVVVIRNIYTLFVLEIVLLFTLDIWSCEICSFSSLCICLCFRPQ